MTELKAFFGMHLVMGYHTLQALRDYWSTDPDLGVTYLANVMCLKRFEKIFLNLICTLGRSMVVWSMAWEKE